MRDSSESEDEIPRAWESREVRELRTIYSCRFERASERALETPSIFLISTSNSVSRRAGTDPRASSPPRAALDRALPRRSSMAARSNLPEFGAVSSLTLTVARF